MKNASRRDFLKKGALLVAALSALPVFSFLKRSQEKETFDKKTLKKARYYKQLAG